MPQHIICCTLAYEASTLLDNDKTWTKKNIEMAYTTK